MNPKLEKIRQQAIADAKKEVPKVIKGEKEIYETNLISPSDMHDILCELGLESIQPFETNGWQWDFWETWLGDGDDNICDKFMLSGSGYYGGMSFRKLDKDGN